MELPHLDRFVYRHYGLPVDELWLNEETCVPPRKEKVWRMAVAFPFLLSHDAFCRVVDEEYRALGRLPISVLVNSVQDGESSQPIAVNKLVVPILAPFFTAHKRRLPDECILWSLWNIYDIVVIDDSICITANVRIHIFGWASYQYVLSSTDLP